MRRNKPKAFAIAEYVEQRKRAQQVLKDGIFEFMNVQKYIKWAGKKDDEMIVRVCHCV